jgi:hypothetical protein
MKTILLIGGCGSGKTYVMKQIINNLKIKKAKIGLFRFCIDESKNIAILGVYDGTTFEGSDKLSMAIMKDAEVMRKLQILKNFTIICEGDRFTNSTFIKIFKPIIVKINDKGENGRKLRNSKQSDRHIKAIQTRVDNINEHYLVKNSTDAFNLIKIILFNEKN